MEIKKTGEEYDPKTKTRTTYYNVYFEAPSKVKTPTVIVNSYAIYFPDPKECPKPAHQFNMYIEGATKDWKNAEVTKKYDFGFRIFGRVVGLVYKPSTIIWWLKKWFNN